MSNPSKRARNISVKVTINNPVDLDKLRFIVSLSNVEYQVEAKSTIASIAIKVVMPNTAYVYGGLLPMTGNAQCSFEEKRMFKEPEEINARVAQMQLKGDKELAEIKKEIASVLKSGVSSVSIDLSDILERILSTIIE